LLNHPDYPDNPTTRNVIKGLFEAPENVADNYGQHLYTWIKAPLTGNYTFHIASDDQSRLYLSSDENPENAVRIAEVTGWTNSREWSKYPEQQSELIHLKEGEFYFLSAIMKEAQGGDNLAVRWDMPDGTMEAPIDAQHCYLPARNFHTNFSISSSGEEIILTRPDGTIADEMLPVPIPANVSYGRVPGENVWSYFQQPTPGEANSTPSFEGISPPPLISPSGGVHRSMVNVSLNSDDPDATIWYTTNGSEPGEGRGFRYQRPFAVNNTTYIRAVGVSPNKINSEVVAETYTIANADLTDFSSNLPVMVIHEFNTPVTAGDRTVSWMYLLEAGEDGRVELNHYTSFSGRIKINMRGSSSLTFTKKGYGFHTIAEDDSNRKISLLGMPEEHNWILHGPFSDKSLMRNALSYSIGEDAGHYSPRTRFIELFLHSGTSQLRKSDYLGVYVLTERIKIAPGRVDLEELDSHHDSYPEVSGGYIFKIDRLNSGESGFRTRRHNRFGFVRPDEATITNSQRNYLISYLDSLESALFGTNFRDPENGYAKYLDVRSFIDMHLITELAKEIDGFRLSSFFYKDRQGKVHAGPLWDFNLSFGNAEYNQGYLTSGWYYSLLSDNDYSRGWYKRMFQDPDFTRQYRRRYQSLRLTAFSEARLLGRINNYYDQLLEAQKRNFERWDIMGIYIWPNWFIAQTWQEEIAWMTDWVKQRLKWMDSQLGQPLTMIHYWNFNQDSLLIPSYTISDANVIINGGAESWITSGEGQDFNEWNARNNDEAGNHLRINNALGSEIIFNVPSVNYQNLLFSYEARRSGSGPNLHYISYSVDGETFIPLDTLIITELPHLQSIDLQKLMALMITLFCQ
jgi:hypothetical protein